MKRRDVLKGAAVAAGVAVVGLGLPKVVGAETAQTLTSEVYDGKTRRMKVELHVYPDKDGKFSGRLQELVEDWQQRSERFRPTGKVTWEPVLQDGTPWLVHSAWLPASEDNLSVLLSESRDIFREHRWDLIQRAINLREMGYWRQEYGSMYQDAHSLGGGGMSQGWGDFLMYRRVVRKRLYKVVVRFEAVSLAEIRRYLGVTNPEYDRLEGEIDALEALRADGKLTPRTYYEKRNERFERLAQIETAALS
jgi:hypothetical protein